MLYLIDELFHNVAVRRWGSKLQVAKTINRQSLEGNVQSLLSVAAAEHYSELFNMSIPANDPGISGIGNVHTLAELNNKLALGDQCFSLLTPEVYEQSSIPLDDADAYLKKVDGFFVYSGYYDQPLLDFLTYDYQSQVDIENALVRAKLLEHVPISEDNGKLAIETVTDSLKRLLRYNVIEITPGDREEFLAFKPNKKLLETSNRHRFYFRLTGQPQSGLFVPQTKTVPVNPNQLTLFGG